MCITPIEISETEVRLEGQIVWFVFGTDLDQYALLIMHTGDLTNMVSA